MGEAAEDFIESSEIYGDDDGYSDYDTLDEEMWNYSGLYCDD